MDFNLTHCKTPTIMVDSRKSREINNLRGFGMIDLERQQFFWSRTQREGDHLIWTGSAMSRGYGFMYFDNGERVYASRVAYCIGKGLDLKDIEDLLILKTCDRNDCVKFDHLVAKVKKKK